MIADTDKGVNKGSDLYPLTKQVRTVLEDLKYGGAPATYFSVSTINGMSVLVPLQYIYFQSVKSGYGVTDTTWDIVYITIYS